MRVLAFAGHPDDEVLGVGGTLLRHKAAGDEVQVAIWRKCRDSWGASDQARRRLGVPYWLMDEGTPEEIVGEVQPDIVYTHSLADLHHEHRALHELVLVACRPQSGVKAIYAFETPSATDWGMRPFLPVRFVEMSARLLDAKCDVMAAYASELRPPPHPRNLDSLRDRAAYWGQRAGVAYAEAFEVIREVW